jgi:hypothetical protein
LRARYQSAGKQDHTETEFIAAGKEVLIVIGALLPSGKYSNGLDQLIEALNDQFRLEPERVKRDSSPVDPTDLEAEVFGPHYIEEV